MTTTITSQPPPPRPPPCQPSQNMSYSLSSTSANPPRSSRPKLTLQTACVPRSFGKSNTGLSLPFVSDPTASPTVRNTFKNAYDVSVPSASAPTPAPLSPAKSSVNNKPCKHTARFAPSCNSNSTTTTANNNNNNNNNPYQLPLGVKSILLNSPLDTPSRRRSSSIVNCGCSGTPRRVFFPAKKQVSYRHPLEEEIRTVHFTARHSDLDDMDSDSECNDVHMRSNNDSESDEDSDSSSSNQSNSDTSTSSDDDIPDGVATLSKFERKKRKILGTEKQIRAVALMDGLDGEGDAYGFPSSSSTPMTPETPRCSTKRRRDWKWTLGPLRPRYDVNDTVPVPQLPPAPSTSNESPTTASVGTCDEVDDKKSMTTSINRQENAYPITTTANDTADQIIKPPSMITFPEFSGFSSFSTHTDPYAIATATATASVSARPDDEAENNK